MSKARGEPAEFAISYLGTTVRVACSSPGLAGVLRSQFLAYGVTGGQARGDDPAVRICLTGDEHELPPGWERLTVPHSGGDLLSPAGVTMLHSGPPLSVVTIARPDIAVLTSGAAPYLPFVHYLVKYPLRAAVERQGAVLAHSAAVAARDGSCCLFLGQGGAGKTTVFIEMLTRGLKVLGNDATLLRPRDGQVQAVLWPHVVRIGAETARRNRVLAALPENWAPRNPRDGKIEVFLDKLDEIFGRRIGSEPGHVAAVASLTLDPASARTAIRRLNQEEARRVLRERLAGDRPRTGWLPGWQWQPDPRHLRVVAGLLARNVPAYRIRVGAATGAWADELARWISEHGQITPGSARHGPDRLADSGAPPAELGSGAVPMRGA